MVHPRPHGASITRFAGAPEGFDQAGIQVNRSSSRQAGANGCGSRKFHPC